MKNISTVVFLFWVFAVGAQSFNFQLGGGVADMRDTEQGANLFYTIGVGFTSDMGLGVVAKGKRAYFENEYPQDNYELAATYKVIDKGVYDMQLLAGASYIRSPFYLNAPSTSYIDDYFSPLIGVNNLIAVGELIDINVSVEATTQKFISYVGLGVVVNLVFETESRKKRFY